ncbi:MAG: aminotransferase class III-fold pyridoxal phosphate-dependent enzyme [Deltaproteobacteria bacterium]|jgi:taurine-pyruvate aminotransferase|nr:aminotransferase class III-fold pyridoxal phosphate-dependent enzyme [Deltaproteobacteria bacterium]
MSTKSAEYLIEADVKNVWHHLMLHQGKAPMIIVEGKGLRLKDIHGKEYLDATSGGVWCVNVGYGRAEIAEAVCAQMKKMVYYAASGGNLPTIEFSEKLLSHMPGLSRVYLSSSGSEANEKAYKMVRLLAYNGAKKEKKKILYRYRDYHGTTIGALSSCGQPERRECFGPFVEGFAEVPHACCYRCAFGQNYPGCALECVKAVEDVIRQEGPDTVGAIIFEPITAGGGIIPPVAEYYEEVSAICKKYGVLVIMDEVVCGMGRTGAMFGYQHYGIAPDMVTLAKGVASAYMPISCTVTTENVFSGLQASGDKLGYFRDISTFGGCAAGPAAALENMRIIEREKLLANVTAMGAYLMEGLKETLSHPNVGDVRGKGLLAGIEFVVDKTSKNPLPEEKVIALCGEMAANGVLVGRTNRCFPEHNNIINLAPAYIVTRADIDIILKTLREALISVLGHAGK